MAEELLSLFERYLRVRKLSSKTVESYLFDVKSLLKFEDFYTRFKILNVNDLRKFLAERKEDGIKATSNARMISAIKSFYGALKKHEICDNTEVFKLTPPKLPKSLPRALSTEDTIEMLDFGEDENWVNLRNKAILTLIYATGMRIAEALSLKKRDFVKSSSFIKVLGKGEKERTIPLLLKAKEAIESYIKACPISLLPDYPLFVEAKRDAKTNKPISVSARKVQKIMQEQRKIKGLPNFATPHSLRHSFATHIISKGGDLRSVQGLLGHSSLSTTQKYVKIDEKTLQNAYSKFHPKG